MRHEVVTGCIVLPADLEYFISQISRVAIGVYLATVFPEQPLRLLRQVHNPMCVRRGAGTSLLVRRRLLPYDLGRTRRATGFLPTTHSRRSHLVHQSLRPEGHVSESRTRSVCRADSLQQFRSHCRLHPPGRDEDLRKVFLEFIVEASCVVEPSSPIPIVPRKMQTSTPYSLQIDSHISPTDDFEGCLDTLGAGRRHRSK